MFIVDFLEFTSLMEKMPGMELKGEKGGETEKGSDTEKGGQTEKGSETEKESLQKFFLFFYRDSLYLQW